MRNQKFWGRDSRATKYAVNDLYSFNLLLRFTSHAVAGAFPLTACVCVRGLHLWTTTCLLCFAFWSRSAHDACVLTPAVCKGAVLLPWYSNFGLLSFTVVFSFWLCSRILPFYTGLASWFFCCYISFGVGVFEVLVAHCTDFVSSFLPFGSAVLSLVLFRRFVLLGSDGSLCNSSVAFFILCVLLMYYNFEFHFGLFGVSIWIRFIMRWVAMDMGQIWGHWILTWKWINWTIGLIMV